VEAELGSVSQKETMQIEERESGFEARETRPQVTRLALWSRGSANPVVIS
jgi:hypothetical protein